MRTPPARLAFASRAAYGVALHGGSAALPPQLVRLSPALAMPASLTVTLAQVVTTLPATVPNMDAPARVRSTVSGASLRDRAIRSNLRSLALPAITAPIPRASAPFGRCALRLPGGSPRSPWPAAPAAGLASARRRCTPCVAGDGFAVHRPPHFPAQQCPRKCRHCRRTARRGASHQCPRSRRRARPLTRRGGSPPPGSPASIPPSLIHRESGSDRPGPALGLTPHASLMQACHCDPWRVLAGSFEANRGHAVVGASAWRAPFAGYRRPGPPWPRLSPTAWRGGVSAWRTVRRVFPAHGAFVEVAGPGCARQCARRALSRGRPHGATRGTRAPQ